MKNYQKIKEIICKEFNPKKYIPDYAFLRANVVICELDNKFIVVIRNKSLSYKNPVELVGYEILKDEYKKPVFNKIASITYSVKNNYIHFSQIYVITEKQGQGIGSAMLKSMEHFSTMQGFDNIKIIGYIGPDNWSKIDEVKSFYINNGYKIKKPLFEKHPIITKIVNKPKILKNDYEDLIVLDCSNTQEITK